MVPDRAGPIAVAARKPSSGGSNPDNEIRHAEPELELEPERNHRVRGAVYRTPVYTADAPVRRRVPCVHRRSGMPLRCEVVEHADAGSLAVRSQLGAFRRSRCRRRSTAASKCSTAPHLTRAGPARPWSRISVRPVTAPHLVRRRPVPADGRLCVDYIRSVIVEARRHVSLDDRFRDALTPGPSNNRPPALRSTTGMKKGDLRRPFPEVRRGVVSPPRSSRPRTF